MWEKWLAFSPDPQYLSLYARWDPGMVIRCHGHFSPHVVYVISGDMWCGDRYCPAGTHIELPLGASFGPFVAGAGGTELLEVMMGDPRSWGDRSRVVRRCARQTGGRSAARSPDRSAGVARGPPFPLGGRRRAGRRRLSAGHDGRTASLRQAAQPAMAPTT